MVQSQYDSINVAFYDVNKKFLSYERSVPSFVNRETVTPSNAFYMRITITKSRTSEDGFCINLSWSGWRNGENEPYEKHSYPLDDSLTLRCIPKLDAQNNLYYDGDEYLPDGTVNRRYGVVDLGELTWNKNKNSQGDDVFSSIGIQTVVKNGLCICSRYKTNTDTARPASMTDKTLSINATPLHISGNFASGEIVIKKILHIHLRQVQSLKPPCPVSIWSTNWQNLPRKPEPYQHVQICDDFGTGGVR